MKRIIMTLVLGFLLITGINAQQKKAGPHDFGRMWTFENPPKEWLAKAYNFTPDDQWFKDVRMAALRMNTGCSASFVSPNGLIMTNHHCSRDAVLRIQREDEDIMNDGFFATTMSDERQAVGVFFEQLRMLADVSSEMHDIMNHSSGATLEAKEAEAIDSIKSKYSKMEGWKDLRLQIVKYYSGVKYSLYGYKKFDNIKLVAIPETDIAFYGGDPDNFTYPRYDVDFTFWRAYDEDGKPVDSSPYYFKFNPEGAKENELVFVIGNPGRTERYRTVAQLEWDRDYRYPMTLGLLRGILKYFKSEYEKHPSEAALNTVFGISNSEKAYTGIYKGLKNPELFNRKVEIEQMVRKNHKGEDYWKELETEVKNLTPHTWALLLLSPSPYRGSLVMLMHSLNKYEEMLKKGAPEDELDDLVDQINYLLLNTAITSSDSFYNSLTFDLLNKHIYKDNNSMKELLEGRTPEEYIKYLKKNSKFFKGDKWKKLMVKDPEKFAKKKDPLLKAARLLIPQYWEAQKAFDASADKRKKLEGKIVKEYFKYFGDNLPPDATFTLRLSDGVVKGYKYNGTIAPYKTTFFGMYDRNYSFDHKYPWRLPFRWKYPSMELLKQPLDFVSTNDIIGGNSGSAIINKNKEVVGLIFDGNIESLPGNFIFDEEYNRAVSVHAGGIYAALKYVYHFKRLMDELVPEGEK